MDLSDLRGAFAQAAGSDIGRAALDLAAGRQLGGYGLPQVMASPVAAGGSTAPLGTGNNAQANANPARTASAGFNWRLWVKPVGIAVAVIGVAWLFLRKRR